MWRPFMEAKGGICLENACKFRLIDSFLLLRHNHFLFYSSSWIYLKSNPSAPPHSLPSFLPSVSSPIMLALRGNTIPSWSAIRLPSTCTRLRSSVLTTVYSFHSPYHGPNSQKELCRRLATHPSIFLILPSVLVCSNGGWALKTGYAGFRKWVFECLLIVLKSQKMNGLGMQFN